MKDRVQIAVITIALLSVASVGCDNKERVLEVKGPNGGLEVDRDMDSGAVEIDMDTDE